MQHEGARVGANAVVVASVEAHTTVVGIPAKPISHAGRDEHCDDSFVPYGTPIDDLPDPVGRALKGLLDEVATLRARVNELETAYDDDRLDPLPLAGGDGERKRAG